MKILIAEDDFASRKFMLRFLQKFGECDITVDGLEAVDAFLIALDILFFTGFQIRITFKSCLPFKVVIDCGNDRLAVRTILLFVHPL